MDKQYIKDNADRIVKWFNLYQKIRARDGYKLGLFLRGINRDFRQGVEIDTYNPDDYEQGGMIWREKDGKPQYMRGDAEMVELLEAVFNDEEFFETIKDAQDDYQGRIKWRIDECISGYDFEKYKDAYYTEQTITLNPVTMRVSVTKPREYSRSVLVALNID